MAVSGDWRVRLRLAVRMASYVTAILLVLFGAWWAGFAGFLMPSQMHVQVTFGRWHGIGMAALGAVNFVAILVLRRPQAWIAPAISGVGLLALQSARIAVFSEPYLNTDWWVTFTAVTISAALAFVGTVIRPGEAQQPRQ